MKVKLNIIKQSVVIFLLLTNCSGSVNILYLIESVDSQLAGVEFSSKRKILTIHKDNNEVSLSTNLKLKDNVNHLDNLLVELYSSRDLKINDTPLLYIRPEDLRELNENRSDFHKVTFKFNISDVNENHPVRRYQIEKNWINKAKKFKLLSGRPNSPYSSNNSTNFESPTEEKNLSLTELVKSIEPSVFLVMNQDSYGNTQSIGTGFFIDSNRAVSNHHVFEGGSRWFIKLSDGRAFEVKEILKQSKTTDFVIFSLKTENKFPFLKLSNREPLKGEDIVVLGNPNGLESTITRGIVSAIRDKLIQIDAAISPGSSGSPVLNLKGEVLGIATLKVVDCENCNLAYKISVLAE